MKRSIFKRISLLLMCMTLVLSLVACGSDKDKDNNKEVTADELLDSIFVSDEDDEDKKELSNAQIDMTVEFGMDINLKQAMLDQGLSESDIEEALESGEITEDNLNMNLALEMDIKAKIDDDKSYTESDMKIEVLGENQSQTTKTYTFEEDGEIVTVTYDDELEQWYKFIDESNDDSAVDMLESMEDFKDYIKSSEIIDEDDDIYTVEVVIDSEKINEKEEMKGLLDEVLGDVVSDSESVSKSIKDIKMTLEIDADNDRLVGISVDLKDVMHEAIKEASEEAEDGEDYSKYITITEFYIELEVSKYGDVEIELTDEVKNAEELDFDVDFNGDEDLFDDEDIFDEDNNTTILPVNDKAILYDYSNNKVAEVKIPHNFIYSDEYSNRNAVVLEFGEYHATLWIVCYTEEWVEAIENGEEWEVDTDWYISDKVEKLDTVSTSQGDAKMYKRTYSVIEGYTYVKYAVVIDKSEDSIVAFSIDETNLEETGYNSLEELINALFN